MQPLRQKFPLADNGQIPRMQLEIPFVETVAASSAQAEQMSQMNYQVGVEGKPAAKVARDFLVKEGLIKN